MDKKLFYVVDDGENSITVPEHDLANIIKYGLADHNENTSEEEMPVYTVSPVYMTQEEFDNMPEYQG